MAENKAPAPQDAVIAEEKKHPLLSVNTAIESWSTWMSLWREHNFAELKLGLLHVGFQVETTKPGQEIERLCFYLDVADDYANSYIKNPNERDPSYSWPRFQGKTMPPYEIRRILARKAFEVVTNALFKNREKEGSHPSWLWLVEYPVLVDKVLWFFRVDEDSPLIRNCNGYGIQEVYQKIVLAFLSEFAMLGWTFKCFGEYAGASDRIIQKQLRQRRPQFIEILWGIGELKMLFDQQYKLDEACLAKLEELAFRRELWLPTEKKEKCGTFWGDTHRKPATLAEAHYGGSMPAIVLTHRRIVAEQQERFDRLQELSERRDELEREQAALQPTA